MLALSAACGDGATVTVFAASSLTDVFPVVIERYETANPDARVSLSLGGSQSLAAQIEEGAPVGVFVSANPLQAVRLESAGLVERRATLIENRLVIAVEDASPLRSLADVAAGGVRIAVGSPHVPVGALTRAAIELIAESDRSLAAGLRANVVTEDPNVRVAASRVELGEADAAFIYHTDVAVIPGLRAIELPPNTPRNEYVVVLVAGAERSVEAARFFEFLLTPEAVELFATAGFTIPATALSATP